MVKSRLLSISAIILTAIFAVISTLLMPASAASIALSVPSVVLALIAIAAVAAVLAATYHPSLFSWRKSTGSPFAAAASDRLDGCLST